MTTVWSPDGLHYELALSDLQQKAKENMMPFSRMFIYLLQYIMKLDKLSADSFSANSLFVSWNVCKGIKGHT